MVIGKCLYRSERKLYPTVLKSSTMSQLARLYSNNSNDQLPSPSPPQSLAPRQAATRRATKVAPSAVESIFADRGAPPQKNGARAPPDPIEEPTLVPRTMGAATESRVHEHLDPRDQFAGKSHQVQEEYDTHKFKPDMLTPTREPTQPVLSGVSSNKKLSNIWTRLKLGE